MIACKHQTRLELHPSFFLFVCAYYYFDPAGSFLPFFLSALCHEMGHLLSLHLLDIPAARICLRGSGAVLETAPLTYRQELAVAAAGPLANLALLLIFLHRMPLLALVNLWLLLYNLLPFYPLDGGRLLRCLLALLFTAPAAVTAERSIGIIFAVLLTGLCIYLTCFGHLGLWPMLLFFSMILRLKGCQESLRHRAFRLPQRT